MTLGIIASGAAAIVHDDRTNLLHQASSKEDELSRLDREKYEAFISDPNSGSYTFWTYRNGQRVHHRGRADFAERVLTTYGLLDNHSAVAWDEAEIARLEEPERSDALAWVVGQALVYAIELSRDEYDAFPQDRERALSCLNRILRAYPIAPLQVAASHLHAKLGGDSPIVLSTDSSSSLDWLHAYLDGVLAETMTPAEAEAFGIPPSSASLSFAIKRYHAALDDRPELYWARYRLASALAQAGRFEAASQAFETCMAVRPQAATLWLGKGSCQYYLGAFDEAIANYRQALKTAPRWAVGWRDMALLGARIGRRDLIEEAIGRIRPRKPAPSSEVWRSLRLDLSVLLGDQATPITGLDASTLPVILASELIDTPSDRELRNEVAKLLVKQGKLREALDHYTQILDLEPGYLSVWFDRAIASQRMGSFPEAIQDYRTVADHPNISEFIDQEPTGLMAFILLSAHEARQGNAEAALEFAETAVSYSEQTEHYRGESYYALARAHATAANEDPSHLISAAEALAAARAEHPGFIESVFYADPMLASRRAELAVLLGGVEF
jgi:tetratricopeptide (TPR) repeat protein